MTIAGPAGALEALIETPVGEGESRPAPQPSASCAIRIRCTAARSTTRSWTLARAFQQLGAPTLRFNFRGVGDSAGSYDEGRGETEDALAVVAFGRRRWPGAALWLAGFSFGGVVAVRAARSAQPQRLVWWRPASPGSMSGFDPACLSVADRAGRCRRGGAAATVLEWARTLRPAPQLSVLAGAGHFFHGRLHELRDAVLEFMQRVAAGA